MTRMLTAVVGLVAACGVEGGRPPVARIAADPAVIPEHDDFRTAVALDGTGSSDPIDDPDGVRPLSYTWTITGDEFQFESGDERDAMPVVRFRGDSPAVIELEVEDADGETGSARVQMVLTVP